MFGLATSLASVAVILLVRHLSLAPPRPRELAPPVIADGPDAAALAQFHAAEYSAARSGVAVWITVQYALIPIIFGAWFALAELRDVLLDPAFYWASALVLPLCLVAYQKAMIDALTGLLLIEEHVRPRAIKLARNDEFWFHEPIYRRDVPPDAAYWWFWPPLLSFASPMAILGYRVLIMGERSWWEAAGYVVCCAVAGYVGHLSKQGLALNRKITAAIERHRLSGL